MARKHFKTAPKRTLTLEISLALKTGGLNEEPVPVAPGTCGENRILYGAGEVIAKHIADLLAVENLGGKKRLRERFQQTPPRFIKDNILSIEVSLPDKSPAHTDRPFLVERTLELLEARCSAEALSLLTEDDPAKKSLLGINETLHSNEVELRIRYMDRVIELGNLGLADRTYPGQPWTDEILLVTTGCDYLRQTITAKDRYKRSVNLMLRLDIATYEKLRALGAVHLRVWGRGFTMRKYIRIVEVYWFELVDFAEFHHSAATYAGNH